MLVTKNNIRIKIFEWFIVNIKLIQVLEINETNNTISICQPSFNLEINFVGITA